MDELVIEIENNQTSFSPGQIISGTVRWRYLEPPQKVNLRLFWYTEGKGDEDVSLVEKIEFDGPQISDNRRFEFQLPIGPYSFSGKLISLLWGLELYVDKEFTRKEFVFSPTGSEILLSGTK